MSAFRSLCGRVVQYEWLFLLLLFPIIIFLESESAFILALFPLLWAVRWIGTGRFFPSTPVNWPLYGLLVMAVVSLPVTFDFENSLPMAGGLIWGISFYFALVSFSGQSARRLYLILGGFLLAGAAVTLLGIVHPTFLNRLAFFRPLSDLLPTSLLRIPGDTDGFNANRISGTLLWVVPLTWVLAVTRGAGARKFLPGWFTLMITIMLGVLALLMSLALMFLFSRASQASFLVIMALLFGFLAWRKRWLILVALVVLLIGGGFLAVSEANQVRVQQFVLTISGETTGGTTAVESFSGRTAVWERAYYTIREFPLTGAGMNNFPAVMSTYFPAPGLRRTADVTHAHNQLLIVGTDLGLPGLIAYLALMMGIGWMLWHCWQQGTEAGDKALALGFAASLMAFELFGIFDGIGLGEKPALFFWVLMGMSGALYNRIRGATLSKSGILSE